ncbi:helix-hairpin-helix domain-containing protein [Deinococcus sp. YIM 134068]|uniref:ComEA family DNA-binding protein n=1 Tax=Deinococcus lichenicola TaxID=3118910 RepID=UPI002F922D9F
MSISERHWTLLLAGGVLTVGAFALGPVALPQTRAPVVTRAELPSPAAGEPVAAPEYPTTASVKPLISGKINLNSASQEQLEALPRVGPALAARIVAGRPYHSLADLDRVSGIGPSALATLTPLVTF